MLRRYKRRPLRCHFKYPRQRREKDIRRSFRVLAGQSIAWLFDKYLKFGRLIARKVYAGLALKPKLLGYANTTFRISSLKAANFGVCGGREVIAALTEKK